MNIAEHALKELAKEDKPPKKPPPKAFAIMNSNKDLMLEIIENGGNISSIARNLGLAHITVGKYLQEILGYDARAKAKANGKLASIAAANGKKNPKDGLIYS